MPSRFDPTRTDLMTVEQVAAYLQLNKLTVYRYIREGRIPAARLGKSYRVRKSDLDAFLESHKSRQPVKAAAHGRKKAAPSATREREAAAEIVVAPVRRGRPETDFQVSINPMEWVIRGLH